MSLPPPSEIAEAYARQHQDTAARRARGEHIVGWKVGATSVAGQRALGLAEPVFAPIFADGMLADGAALRSADYARPRLEPELAFVLRAAPARPLERLEEAAALVGAVVPVFEVIDQRIPADASATELIADGVARAGVVQGAHHRVARGPATAAALVEAVAQTRCTLRVDGHEDREVDAEGIAGGPLASLAWLTRALAAHGGGVVRPGQLVLTGTWLPPLDVEPGLSAQATFGRFGAVGARGT